MKILHIGMCTGPEPLNGLQKAFIKRSSDYREIPSYDPFLNSEARELAQGLYPDIVFLQIQAPGIIQIETVREFKKAGAWVCNFTGDVRVPTPEWYFEMGKEVDHTFFTNEYDVFQLRQRNLKASFLNLGFDPEIYCPAGLTQTNAPEIVFMANHYPSMFALSSLREEVVRRLKQVFGNRFAVYGSGWPAADGNFMGNQGGEAACYRGTKIAINCSHFDLNRYSSDRILRIMGSGAFCLSKWFPGWQIDYSHDHLAIWQSVDELIDLCAYYLQNEDRRIAIAQAGCELVHSHDTFDHMVDNLISFYEQR